jgi:hypothetical protein
MANTEVRCFRDIPSKLLCIPEIYIFNSTRYRINSPNQKIEQLGTNQI